MQTRRLLGNTSSSRSINETIDLTTLDEILASPQSVFVGSSVSMRSRSLTNFTGDVMIVEDDDHLNSSVVLIQESLSSYNSDDSVVELDRGQVTHSRSMLNISVDSPSSAHERSSSLPGTRGGMDNVLVPKCPVCFASFLEIKEKHMTLMTTVCGHVFCEACIKAAVQTQPRCPICRRHLKRNDVHPIYID